MAYSKDTGSEQQVIYQGLDGIHTGDQLFTRDPLTKHTEATREYDSTQTINTFTSPVSFVTTNTNGTFTIGDQVETWLGEAQAEVLDIGTTTTTEPQYTNLVYSGVGLNDLTSIYVGGYSGSYPVSYTVEVLQNNVAYSPTGMLSGTISIGDTITGLTSGATATVVAIDQFKNVIAVDTIVGTFIPSEIVQGNTPSDFISIGGDFSTLADIVLISNTNANSIITTIAGSQLEGVETSFSSLIGHTIGDTWTFDILPNTTLTIIYLTNITGTLPISSNTRLNNLTTPFQTDDGNIIAAQFTIGDTVDVIDLSGFTTIGNIQITGVSGDIFQYVLNSGTISLGNYLYSGTKGKQGFVYDIDSSIVTNTISTGFRTEPIQFPGLPSPLEASALVSDNGTDKAAIGVFDLTPFGQEDGTPAIIKFYGDGSQATFSMSKSFSDMSVFDQVTGKSANLSLNLLGDDIGMSGYDGTTNYGWNATPNSFDYQTNGNAFKLPISFNGVGSVVADLSGNGILTMEPLSSLIGPIVNKTTDTDPLFTGTLFSLMHIPSFIYGVYVNGVYQNEGADYTISGVDITFTTTIVSSYVTVVYEYL